MQVANDLVNLRDGIRHIPYGSVDFNETLFKSTIWQKIIITNLGVERLWTYCNRLPVLITSSDLKDIVSIQFRVADRPNTIRETAEVGPPGFGATTDTSSLGGLSDKDLSIFFVFLLLRKPRLMLVGGSERQGHGLRPPFGQIT